MRPELKGKIREEKRRNGNRGGVRDGRTRQKGGRRKQNLSPLPRTEPHRGSGETSLRGGKKPKKKKKLLSRDRRELFNYQALFFY